MLSLSQTILKDIHCYADQNLNFSLPNWKVTSLYWSQDYSHNSSISNYDYISLYYFICMLIFFLEFSQIDSVMSSRQANEHDASRRLKSEFLIQFDGVTSDQDALVIVIGSYL